MTAKEIREQVRNGTYKYKTSTSAYNSSKTVKNTANVNSKLSAEQIRKYVREGKYNFDYSTVDRDVEDAKRTIFPNRATDSDLVKAAAELAKNNASSKNTSMSYDEKLDALKDKKKEALKERIKTTAASTLDSIIGQITVDEQREKDAKKDYDVAKENYKKSKQAIIDLKNNEEAERQNEIEQLISNDTQISSLVEKAYSNREIASEKTSVAAGTDDLSTAILSLKGVSDSDYDISSQDKEINDAKEQLNTLLKEKGSSFNADDLISYYVQNQNVLKSQETAKAFEKAAKENPVETAVGRVLSAPYAAAANVATTVGDKFLNGDYIYNSANAIQDARRGIKSGVEQKAATSAQEHNLPFADKDINIFGNDFGNIYSAMYDAIDNGAENAYTSLLLGGGLTGGITAKTSAEKATQAAITAAFTSSTMGEEASELKANGTSIKDAYAQAGKDAAIEFVTEMVGIPFLEGKGGAVGTVASEALEEIVGNALSNLDDVIRLQDEGEIMSAYNNYISEGKSESEALSLTVKNLLADDIFSAGMAAFSSLGMAGTSAVSQRISEDAAYRAEGKAIQSTGNDAAAAVINKGLSQEVNSPAYKAATELLKRNTETDSAQIPEKVSNKKLGQLQQLNVQQNDITAFKNAVSDEENSDSLVKTFEKITEGKSIATRAAAEMLNNETARKTLNQLAITDNIDDQIKNGKIRRKKSRNILNEAATAYRASSASVFHSAQPVMDSEQVRTSVNERLASQPKEKINKDITLSDGTPDTVTSVDSVKGDVVYLNTSNGSVVEASSVKFADEDTANLYKSAKAYSTNVAKTYVMGYTDNGYDGNVYDYNTGFNAVYMAQKQGRSLSDAINLAHEQGSHITDIQAQLAYIAAENDVIDSTTRNNAEDNKETAQSEKALNQGSQTANQKAEKFNSAFNTKKTPGATIIADKNTLSKSQKAEVELLDSFAKSIDREIIIVDDTEELGYGAANGFYKNGKIVLALNADGGLMTPYLGHELFHDLKATSKVNAQQLEDFVIEHLKNDSNYNYDNRVEQLIELNNFKGTREQQIAQANEEIAANACFTVLFEKENFERLVKQDKSLAQKVRNFFADFIKKIKNALADISSRNAEYRALKDDITAKEKILEMFDEALNISDTDVSTKSTGIKFSKKINEYPYNMQTVISDYLNSANRDIADFVIDAKRETNKKRLEYMHKDITFDNLNVLKKISSIAEFDVSKYKTRINGEAIKHIIKRHGENGIHDHSMKNENDIARVAYILNNADNVERTINSKGDPVFSQQYRTMDNKPSPVITISKKINGTYYVAMAVPDSKAKCMHIESLFIGNKKESVQEFDENIPKPTPEADLESDSNDNVPQNDTSVNSNSMQDETKNSLKEDSEGNKLSKQQQDFFIDSKARDKEGNLLVLYHQTGADFTVFNTDNQKAGKYDSELPTGIFLKPNNNDIGLSGKKQMKVYANITNPIVVSNRLEAKRYFENNIPRYKAAQDKITHIDKEYQEKYDDADIHQDELYKELFQAFKEKRITSGEFKHGIENTEKKKILNEWTNESDTARLEAKILIDEYFADSDYDGMVVLNDTGSFGRSVNTYIAFNSNQIKNIDNISPTDDVDIRYSLKEQPIDYNAILEENEELSEMNEDLKQMLELTSAENEKLKNEFKITDRHNISNNAVDKVAVELRKQYSSNYGKSELVSRLSGLYDYMANAGTDIDMGYVWNAASGIAKNIVANSQHTDTTIYDEYRELRNRIRSTQIRVPETVKNNFSDYDSFRRNNFGRLRLSDNGTELDSFYNELSSEYPEFFDTNVSEEQQLEALANFFEVTSPVYYNASEQAAESMGLNENQYTNLIASDIFEKYFDVPEVLTVAEKHKKEISALKTHYHNRINEMRQSYKDRYEERLREIKESNKQKINNLRESKAEALAKQKAHFEEVGKNASERRKKSKLRASIRKSLSKIASLGANPNKKKHIPNAIIDSVKALADAVTLDDTLKQDQKLSLRLNEFKNGFEHISGDSQYSVISELYNDYIQQKVIELQQRAGDKTISELSVQDLGDINELLKMTVQSINNINRLFLKGRNESIDKYAENIFNELAPYKKGEIRNGITKSLAYNTMKPEYFFRYIGSETLLDLYHELRKGEDTWALDISEARNCALEIRKKYDWKKWDSDSLEKFDTIDGEIELTLQERLAIYANSLGEHTKNHLYGGGFVYQEPKVKGIKGTIKSIKKLGKQRNDNSSHRLSIEDVANIVDSLTTEQCSYVRDMIKYLSSDMAQKGNEITRELYDVDLFKESTYYPAKVNREATHQTSTEIRAEKQLKNAPFTNSAVQDAKQPLVLMDFDDVWASHVDEMSKYHAFVLPLENFDRVYNLYEVSSDYEYTSIKESIKDAYGDKALTYIDDLIKDINGGVVQEAGTDIISNLTSKFKKNAVFASASVAIQQPSAIGRALSEVDAKYFAKTTFSGFNRKSYEEMKKYAPIAIIKEMGYFDTNMARSTIDFLNNNEYKGIKEKAKAFVEDGSYRDDVMSFLASKADEITWTHIWNACKAEIKSKSKDLTDVQMLEKAGERFTEVITKTQVYDSVFSRSGLMRSRDSGVKNVTAFMAEPTTSLNMLIDATIQAKRGTISKAKAARVFGSLMVASVLNSLLQSVVTAARADDDDKDWAEAYIAELIPNFIDNLNPLNQIAWLRDAINIWKGYDVTRADMNLFSDFYDAINNLSSDKVTITKKITGLTGAISAFLGIPTKNFIRDIESLSNVVKDFFDDKKFSSDTALDLFKEEMNSCLGFELFNSKLENAIKGIEKGDMTDYEEYADEIYASSDAYDLLYSVLKKYGYNSSQYKTAEDRCIKIKQENGAANPNPDTSMKNKAIKEYAKAKKTGTYQEAEALRQNCIQLYGSMDDVQKALDKLEEKSEKK